MIPEKKHVVWDALREETAHFDAINEKISSWQSPVQRFYEGSVIFITGGSGFLGKQLVEKLFRSCRIEKVYLLLRTQKSASVQRRVQMLMQNPVYDYLHKQQPEFVNKIVPVDGDITKSQLGIDDKRWQELASEVNVIIHSAATVNFTETLKRATITNVRGTQEILNFAKACKNLKSVVHVSTAYTHATEQTAKQCVLEKFYESSLSPESLLKLIDEFDDDKLEALTPQLLKNWPNTYSFTKAVAEELVRVTGNELPICIVRPAIVVGAIREPPGWIDKSAINGPIGFAVGASLGALHVAYGDENMQLDMVPVDIVNNAVIVAAKETAARRARGETDIKIYTVTRTRNPLSFHYLIRWMSNDEIRYKFSSPKIIWYPYFFLTKNKLMFTLLSWALHFFPGYLADAVLFLIGRKTKAVRLLNKAYKQNRVFGHYMMNEWQFSDNNLLEMFYKMSPVDQVIFNYNISTTTVENFFALSLIACRKYITKDDLFYDDFQERKVALLKILNLVYIVGYLYFLWKVLCTVFYVFQGLMSV